MRSLLEVFCAVDDFCQQFEPVWRQPLGASGRLQRQRARRLSVSEVMTILIVFHHSHYRTLKAFYTTHVLRPWRTEFPGLVSYSRFVEFIPSTLGPLCAYLRQCYGSCTGTSFVEATALAVCHNRRIAQHKGLADLAARGRTSGGWFFGLKRHLVVNDRGELLRGALTPGNTDDRKPGPQLAHARLGKLVADKGLEHSVNRLSRRRSSRQRRDVSRCGWNNVPLTSPMPAMRQPKNRMLYISAALTKELLTTFGGHLLTPLKRQMKPRRLLGTDKLLLRKRASVETIFDQLKNISQIEHSRHRSPSNFLVHLLCGLIAYCHQPKKPALHLPASPTFPLA